MPYLDPDEGITFMQQNIAGITIITMGLQKNN